MFLDSFKCQYITNTRTYVKSGTKYWNNQIIRDRNNIFFIVIINKQNVQICCEIKLRKLQEHYSKSIDIKKMFNKKRPPQKHSPLQNVYYNFHFIFKFNRVLFALLNVIIQVQLRYNAHFLDYIQN